MREASRRNPTSARSWRRCVNDLFASAYFELSVGVLVVISVALTLIEFMLEAPPSNAHSSFWLSRANDLVTAIFAVELTLRATVAVSKRRFFNEFFLDIVAVLPIDLIFPGGRAFRILRLIRLLRMFGVVSRLSGHFPYIIRRGAVEYVIASGLLVLTILFATGAIMFFENQHPTADGEQTSAAAVDTADSADGTTFDLEDSFWFSVYSLFAGEPIPGPPQTLGGKIVAVFVMFMGLTIFAMFTGTVSAFMVERLRLENGFVEWETLQDHVVICGWSTKAEIIIAEYRATPSMRLVPIVVVSEFDGDRTPVLRPELQKHVHFLSADFTRIPALEKVGIHRANTCIVLADTSGTRSEQDADARTILAALTVEKLNPNVFTCAELMNASYGTHLKMGGVNDYVVSGEYGAYLLAQAATNRGLMSVFTELMTYERGNEFYRMTAPGKCIGKSFRECLGILKDKYDVILIAVHPSGGEMLINPKKHQLAEGDDIVVIATAEPSFD
jgi:voltage-gated potassium channel